MNVIPSHFRPGPDPSGTKPSSSAKTADRPKVQQTSQGSDEGAEKGLLNVTEALAPQQLVRVAREALESRDSSSGDEKRKQLEEIAERANAVLAQSNTHLEFIVTDQTGRTVINIVDNETQEIIRQIPPVKLSQFAARLSEMRGLLFDAQG